MSVCNSMLTSLLSEMPNMDGLQEILIHTNGWMESEMPHELERAVRSTSHVLKLAAEHLDFDVSEEFSLLGQLVAVLGMRTMDSVKEIGLQAAEAMYHLHHLTMSKMVKEIEKRPKNKKGNIVKWEREDLFISSRSVFHNDASKVAKVLPETAEVFNAALFAFCLAKFTRSDRRADRQTKRSSISDHISVV
ncbi:maestro heat-like repeat family member 5 [Paroedura picta]|uniref:maestro heat-like repeat family member 5 n=1 Tax=Paroedura picta TaxID=143630 RepID=UPI004055DAC2